MKIVRNKVPIGQLEKMAEKFGGLVKAVVDIEKEIIVIDGELHSDEERLLLEKGSDQKDLWGINIYPDRKGKYFIEFDSMINLRPYMKNLSRSVDDPEIRQKILRIINKLMDKKRQ